MWNVEDLDGAATPSQSLVPFSRSALDKDSISSITSPSSANQLPPSFTSSEQGPLSSLYVGSHSQSGDSDISKLLVDRSMLINSYLPLKLAIDLVPKFDGTSPSLTTFLKQCKLANSRIKPADKLNLLALIRNKIFGRADRLISQKREAETLEELEKTLKCTLIRTFDLDNAHIELSRQNQGRDETIEVFGYRVVQILNRAIDAADERFNAEQAIGVRVLLEQTAIKGFIRGLNNSMISTVLNREENTTLEKIITLASKLEEPEKDQNEQKNQNHQIRENNHRKFFKIDSKYQEQKIYLPYNNKFCFYCKKRGHIEQNCRLKFKRRNDDRNFTLGNREKLCRNCSKRGHEESNCWSKDMLNDKNRDNTKNLKDKHLNWNAAPRETHPRSEIIRGRSNASESTTN